jgi:hypothetical protein
MTGANTAQEAIVPSHGVGTILPPWKPGQSGNPSGRPAGLREVQKLAREKSLTALRALIGIVEDIDERGLPNQDGRVVVVAAQTILTWGYGKPADYNPSDDKPPVVIDTSGLSAEERVVMLKLLRKGIVREQIQDPEPERAQIAGEAA